jgi:hypothetical protein
MSDRPTSGPAPQWGEYAPVNRPETTPAPAPEAPPSVVDPATTTATRPGRPWDRALTIGLLVIGVFNVLTSIPGNLDLPATLDAVYETAGYGDFTADGLASAMGIAVNIVNVVLVIFAVWLATANLRAGRISFWIPLTVGAVSFIVTLALFAIVMFTDPALLAYVERMSGTGPRPSPVLESACP